MDPGMQEAVADEVNNRMADAVADLQAKYANGMKVQETSVDGPTGTAYKDAQKQQAIDKKAAKAQITSKMCSSENTYQNSGDLDDEDADDEDKDEDAELRQIREKRLRQIRDQQKEKLENIGKGHGQYREIVQDEFLAEVTGSMRVIVHFYHRDFVRCSIMDHHLQRLAQRHIETKFVKINAEKAPFFVSKLSIRSMPTLVYFVDGIATGKQIGFEGLAHNMPEGMEDEWPTIVLARILGAMTMINNELIVDDDGKEAELKSKMNDARSAFVNKAAIPASFFDLDEDDFSDNDS